MSDPDDPYAYRPFQPIDSHVILSNRLNKPVSKTNGKVLYVITTQDKNDLRPFQLYARKKSPSDTVYVQGIIKRKTNIQIYTRIEAIKSIQNDIKIAKIEVSKGAKYAPSIWRHKEIKKFQGTVIYIGIDFFIENNTESGCIIEECPDGRQEVYYTSGNTYPERFVKEAIAEGFVKSPNLGRVRVSKVMAKNCPGIDPNNPWKKKFRTDRQDIIMEGLTFKLGLAWDRNCPPNWRRNELPTELL